MCTGITTCYLKSPLFNLPVGSSVTIDFKEGMSASRLINLLSEKDQLYCPLCLHLYLYVLPGADRLQAGIYQFDALVTPKKFVTQLLKGHVLEQKFTIIEGQSSQEIISQLKHQPFLKQENQMVERLLAKCKFCTDNLDGMFLADTYFYLAGSQALDILMRSYLALKLELNKVWQHRNKNLPYRNAYELLIAASIIEKETSLTHEQYLVSAVIVNRLRKNMRLQMDPTVIYGLGTQYNYPLLRKDLKIETPYNTYLNKGLPPTPICNVGSKALFAAAHPKAVDYLYFVATAEGTHHFSNSLAEQIKAIKILKEGQK